MKSLKRRKISSDLPTNYEHTGPIPNKYLGFGYKGLVLCKNNVWLMENRNKGLTVPKWVLINWLKIPQMPQNLSAQKFGISMRKGTVLVCTTLYLTAEYILYIHLHYSAPVRDQTLYLHLWVFWNLLLLEGWPS